MSSQILTIQEKSEQNSAPSTVIGIDFGTSNSLVAISQNNQTKIIPNLLGKDITSSIISINYNNKIDVGNSDSVKEGITSIKSIKRFLGKSTKEILENKYLLSMLDTNLVDLTDHSPKIEIFGEKRELFCLASKIFEYLRLSAELYLKEEITDAVVSIPAYFDDVAKGQVLYAAKLAGLNVIRLIAEPTAAAYAYNLHHFSKGIYLVYDLGGGTFDVSILNMQQAILQTIAVGGDNMLGGDDIDQILLQYLEDNDFITKDIYLKNLEFVRSIKESLSCKTYVELEDKKNILSRSQFEAIIEPVIKKTLNIVREVILDSKVKNIDGIILVGGSTRIPLIRKLLQKQYPKVEFYSSLDPDKVVVLGAAIQAQNLSLRNKKSSLLIDVVALSIGIELYGGLVEKILVRNTPIPCSVSKTFTTYQDNQTSIKIHILQGERELVEDCKSLAYFELDIPPKNAGQIRLEIVFNMDVDGILSVTAQETINNTVAHSVVLKPSFGMSQNDIDRELEVAYKNIKEDYQKRAVAEAKLNAMVKIREIEKFVLDDSFSITKDERIDLERDIKFLKKYIDLDDYSNILLQKKVLDNFAEKLFTRSNKN